MSTSRNKTLENRKTDVKALELLEAIRESDEYREYLHYYAIIKDDPELYDRVCDYRRRNFELQNMDVNDNMFDDVMRFQMENADIRKIDLVNLFLKSELSVCRMLQDTMKEIIDGIDIDLTFLRY